MKRYLIYIGVLGMLLVSFVQHASAQAASFDAKSILDRTAEQFRRSGGVVIGFTMHTFDGEQAGTLKLKGEKLFLDAGGAKTWFDGETQWTYLVANDEVNISLPTPEELQSINPYAWLSLYRQGYALQAEQPADVGLASCYNIRMTATDKRAAFSDIRISITRDTLRPVRISMTQGGDTVLILIDSYRTENLSDALFRFDKQAYPSAEVVDLR